MPSEDLPPCSRLRKGLLDLYDVTSVYEGVVSHVLEAKDIYVIGTYFLGCNLVFMMAYSLYLFRFE